MLISSQDAVLSEYKSFRKQKDNVLSYSRRVDIFRLTLQGTFILNTVMANKL